MNLMSGLIGLNSLENSSYLIYILGFKGNFKIKVYMKLVNKFHSRKKNTVRYYFISTRMISFLNERKK